MELLNPALRIASVLDDRRRQATTFPKAFARIDRSVWIFGAALVALFVKLAIAFNTFGTNDVAAFYLYAKSLHDHGLEWTYRYGVPWSSNPTVFNHPPLTAYYLELIESLSRSEFVRECGFTFPFLLRFPGIIADFIVALVLLRISKISGRCLPAWGLILFALSPVSLMVSGFHGNTDPVMVMFLVLASYMCLKEQPILCGLFFALSCQIKIVPLLFLPILFFFWLHRKAALRFTATYLLLTVAMWSQPLLNFPGLFVRNVLAYGSYWGSWGITYWLQLTQSPQLHVVGFSNFPLAAAIVAASLKVVIVISAFVIGWRRRCLGAAAVIRSIACAWIIFFVFTPGFCVYYLAWLPPFILILSPALYGWLTASSSLFLFVFYNSLAGGLPWFAAVSKFSDPGRFNLLAPWSLWSWAALVCGMIILSKKALDADPSLRFFTLKTVRQQPADETPRP